MLFDLRGCLVARSDRLGTAKAPAAPAHAMRRMVLIHHIGDVCWLWRPVSAVKRQYNMLTQVYLQCVLGWGSNERMLAARPARIEPLYKHFRGIISVQILRAMGSIALVATPLVWWCAGVGVLTNTASADDCLAEPNSPAPAGSHWYYHLDRATQRKCWYIHAKDQPVQPAAAQATSDPASPTPAAPIPLETDQSAQQGAQEAIPQVSPALSIQAPAPQASQSSQTSDQGATTRSVPAPPDPPPSIATFKAQERTAPPSDSPTDFIQPTADTTAGTSVSDDAKSTARDGGSTANAAGTAASVMARPWKLEIRM